MTAAGVLPPGVVATVSFAPSTYRGATATSPAVYLLQNIAMSFSGGALLTVNGPTDSNGKNLMAIDGNSQYGVFFIGGYPGPYTAALNNLIIRNGSTGNGGGVYVESANLTVTNSTLTGNNSYEGGAIAGGNSTLTSIDTTVSGNSSVSPGGGIAFSSGRLTLINSTVFNNSGSGLAITGGGSTAKLINTTVHHAVSAQRRRQQSDRLLQRRCQLPSRSLRGHHHHGSAGTGPLAGNLRGSAGLWHALPVSGQRQRRDTDTASRQHQL